MVCEYDDYRFQENLPSATYPTHVLGVRQFVVRQFRLNAVDAVNDAYISTGVYQKRHVHPDLQPHERYNSFYVWTPSSISEPAHDDQSARYSIIVLGSLSI